MLEGSLKASGFRVLACARVTRSGFASISWALQVRHGMHMEGFVSRVSSGLHEGQHLGCGRLVVPHLSCMLRRMHSTCSGIHRARSRGAGIINEAPELPFSALIAQARLARGGRLQQARQATGSCVVRLHFKTAVPGPWHLWITSKAQAQSTVIIKTPWKTRAFPCSHAQASDVDVVRHAEGQLGTFFLVAGLPVVMRSWVVWGWKRPRSWRGRFVHCSCYSSW